MEYEYWFASLKMSCKRKIEILQNFSSAKELYNIEETALKQYVKDENEKKTILDSISTWDVVKEYQNMKDKGVWFVTITSKQYPKRLRNIPSSPYALFVKGSLPKDDVPTIAIVGARECTPYGELMSRKFAKSLAQMGIQIVSGMARGVDSAGQEGALSAGGTSFGVLGCGVDICYPREKIGLYMKLQEQGGILSEFPFGTNPLPQYFPARNRIISGLADVILVMEAKEKSGSLITADMALEQGKDVYALPGPVNSKLSEGCNHLIRQGAGILLSPEDLLAELGFCHDKKKENFKQNKILLESKENLVYSCLGLEPQNIDELFRKVKLPIAELLDILMRLELRGIVKEISINHYIKLK